MLSIKSLVATDGEKGLRNFATENYGATCIHERFSLDLKQAPGEKWLLFSSADLVLGYMEASRLRSSII